MKNMFKLAAIAVSMALVMSLVACSSGDDDVVDASTSKYLLTAQIDSYVDSFDYDQNVSDKEIESLETAHKNVMKVIGDCEDCLNAYVKNLKDTSSTTISSTNVADMLKALKWCGTEEKFHKMFVYIPAIKVALKDVDTVKEKVVLIGVPNGDTILKGSLNERQAATMDAYTDAAAALKAALSDDDKKTCKTTIDDADKAIEAFGKLENKNVTKAEIKKVTDKVDAMCKDVQTKIVADFWAEYVK